MFSKRCAVIYIQYTVVNMVEPCFFQMATGYVPDSTAAIEIHRPLWSSRAVRFWTTKITEPMNSSTIFNGK